MYLLAGTLTLGSSVKVETRNAMANVRLLTAVPVRINCLPASNPDENTVDRVFEISCALDHNRSIYMKTDSSVVSEK
jgi:hypothetical protein